jgi:hypothetical protein
LIPLFHAFNALSAISFFGFGGYCLVSEAMRREFQRYGLSRYRKMTGWLQLAGAAGLVIGWVMPWVGLAAAGGLSLQMLAGLGVRISIRDPWGKCLPAAFYFVLNALLAWLYGANSDFK